MTRGEFATKLRAVADDYVREHGNHHPAALYCLDAADNVHVDLIASDLLGAHASSFQEFLDAILMNRRPEMAALVFSAVSFQGDDGFLEEGLKGGGVAVRDVGDESLMIWVKDADGGELHLARVEEDEIWGDVSVEWSAWRDVEFEAPRGPFGGSIDFRIPKKA